MGSLGGSWVGQGAFRLQDLKVTGRWGHGALESWGHKIIGFAVAGHQGRSAVRSLGLIANYCRLETRSMFCTRDSTANWIARYLIIRNI